MKKTNVDRAVEWSFDHPKGNQSFYKMADGRLGCHACGGVIKDSKPSNCKRHCGFDEKQDGSLDAEGNKKGSNKGTRHKKGLIVWNELQAGGGAVVASSDEVAINWGKQCLKAGLNAAQCAALAKGWFALYPIDNHRAIPKNESAARVVYNEVAAALRRHFINDLDKFGYSYIKSSASNARKAQIEWDLFVDDLQHIQVLAASENKLLNGERVLGYWEEKKASWPIVAALAIRILMMIIGTMDVERFFSVYQRYMADLDAVNLKENKKNRALCMLNRHRL